MLPDKTLPASYGLPKTNYDTVVDPTTELSAQTEYEPLATDVAAMTHVAPRAWITIDAHATTPAILDHSAVWGDTNDVIPTLTRNNTGDYTITWATAYDDINTTPARQVSRSVAFNFGLMTPMQKGWGYVVTTANTARVYTFDDAGSAIDVDFALVMF